MAIRTNEKSNSHLGRIRERIQSALFASEDAGTDDVDEPDDSSAETPDSSGNLYQCSTCGTVYIDSEKNACSECEEDVEEVRSELRTSPVR